MHVSVHVDQNLGHVVNLAQHAKADLRGRERGMCVWVGGWVGDRGLGGKAGGGVEARASGRQGRRRGLARGARCSDGRAKGGDGEEGGWPGVRGGQGVRVSGCSVEDGWPLQTSSAILCAADADCMGST